MAQELKVCEAYICHNEFSQNELPQKKDAIVKSASHKEEDDWWNYAAKIECYRKKDADKVIAEKGAEIRRLQRALYKACSNWAKSERYTEATWHGDEHREESWANVQTKCLAKVEQYK